MRPDSGYSLPVRVTVSTNIGGVVVMKAGFGGKPLERIYGQGGNKNFQGYRWQYMNKRISGTAKRKEVG